MNNFVFFIISFMFSISLFSDIPVINSNYLPILETSLTDLEGLIKAELSQAIFEVRNKSNQGAICQENDRPLKGIYNSAVSAYEAFDLKSTEKYINNRKVLNDLVDRKFLFNLLDDFAQFDPGVFSIFDDAFDRYAVGSLPGQRCKGDKQAVTDLMTKLSLGSDFETAIDMDRSFALHFIFNKICSDRIYYFDVDDILYLYENRLCPVDQDPQGRLRLQAI